VPENLEIYAAPGGFCKKKEKMTGQPKS